MLSNITAVDILGEWNMLNTFDTRLEGLDGFETEYVKTLYYDLPEKFKGTYSSQEYLRFCTILEGEKNLEVDNERLTYSSDQFIILPAHTSVNMEIPIKTKALVFELSDELIIKVASKIPEKIVSQEKKNKSQSIIIDKHGKQIEGDINNIHMITKRKSKDEAFLIDLYAQKLIFDLLKVYSLDNLLSLKSNYAIRQTENYIKANVSEPIKVSMLAKMSSMTESNYSHAFKKMYGMSPHKYINNSKVEHACGLLREHSVTEVAFELGFENISHFIRLFKQKYDITPKQYQMKLYRF